MPVPRRTLVLGVSFLLLALPLAGCLKKGGEDVGPMEEDIGANESVPNATLPDERGQALAFNETNKTEEGAGGVEHLHDYWKGQTRVVVYDDEAFLSTIPVYPDGEGSQPKSVAYIKLPQPNLIYEGAESVEVLVAPVETCTLDPVPCAPSAVPPALKLEYRTASSDGFVDAGAITPGTPVILKVTPKETDMPHSVSSLWAFRISTDRPDPIDALKVQITAVKGREVVDWPGHPDFYPDNLTMRVVAQKTVSVSHTGAQEAFMYGATSSWVAPEKLISYGTGSLVVFINITSASSSVGAQPAGYFLEYHNATILDAEDEFNERIFERDGNNDLKSYVFEVNVTADGMDGPYQPSSRWGFRPVALFTYSDVPGVVRGGLCPGCFPYEITYDMTILALKSDEEEARLNE